MASTSSSFTDAKGMRKAFQHILPQRLLPSASSSSMVYDVFLNHCGCNAKRLAKDICHALNLMGLQVFLHKEILEYGESIPSEIEDAIRSASLCIAIFCPNYAESTSCLEELSFMVKNNTKIIPIFYDVHPSNLQGMAGGTGVYARAFFMHKEKHRRAPHKLEEWKTALYNVAYLYGHMLRSKEDEDRLLNIIVNSVPKGIGPSTVDRAVAFEDILPQPLLPSASSTSSMVYDVFLNHRGFDVTEGLAKDIYYALSLMGVRVFLDKKVLEYGDSIPRKIKDAMLSASLFIVFFSPHFAESSWCLEELSFMVKNRSTKIIPIFYKVEPFDLRWPGHGAYRWALAHHKRSRRYSPQKLEEWQMALHDVSFFSGFSLSTEEEEDKLLKSIVNYVLKNIGPLEVARYPVAFEDILPQPLLPSASSSSSMVYDVFLNHRGSDVKEGLAKDFYHTLNRMGLRVFLDKEVLNYGDSIPREIEDAMRSASLCIAFFSPQLWRVSLVSR